MEGHSFDRGAGDGASTPRPRFSSHGEHRDPLQTAESERLGVIRELAERLHDGYTLVPDTANDGLLVLLDEALHRTRHTYTADVAAAAITRYREGIRPRPGLPLVAAEGGGTRVDPYGFALHLGLDEATARKMASGDACVWRSRGRSPTPSSRATRGIAR